MKLIQIVFAMCFIFYIRKQFFCFLFKSTTDFTHARTLQHTQLIQSTVFHELTHGIAMKCTLCTHILTSDRRKKNNTLYHCTYKIQRTHKRNWCVTSVGYPERARGERRWAQWWQFSIQSVSAKTAMRRIGWCMCSCLQFHLICGWWIYVVCIRIESPVWEQLCVSRRYCKLLTSLAFKRNSKFTAACSIGSFDKLKIECGSIFGSFQGCVAFFYFDATSNMFQSWKF